MIQRLRGRVHPIIVRPAGKGREFIEVGFQPRRLLRQKHPPAFHQKKGQPAISQLALGACREVQTPRVSGR